jgi:3-oxoacyl-[acyl-carrier-protein] synthase III
MALTSYTGCTIKGIVNVLPKEIADNLDLDLLSEDERNALIAHTGIRYRRVAPEGTTITALFHLAIESALAKTDWNTESIDALICVTQTPSMIIPSVASRLHASLKLPISVLSFDIVSGCAGFVYGLNAIYGILSGIKNKKSRAILCCGDLSTQLIEKTDRSVQPIFSDGVAAILIEHDPASTETLAYFNLESDGSGQHAIEMIDNDLNQSFMRLNGLDVFAYSVKHVPTNIKNLLDFANVNPTTPDYYYLHQANKLINEKIRKKLALPEEKVPYSITEFGNTASASIPVTMGSHWPMQPSTNWVVCSGFGVGFSMASVFMLYQPEFCDIEWF